MTQTYVPLPSRKRRQYDLVLPKNSVETIKWDLKVIEDDIGTVTAATWTLKSGQASIASEALASSIASAVITLSEVGKSRIEIQFTDGTEIIPVNLVIKVFDPDVAEWDGYEVLT